MFTWGGPPERGACLTACPPQEGMLRHLQKSVEEEEQVWKARVSTTEEELQKVQGSLTLTMAQ